MLNAAHGILAMLPVALLAFRARDGVAMTASWPSPIAESASSTIDAGPQVPRKPDGKLATKSSEYVLYGRKDAVSKENLKHG
jgi:hypothetical protein